MRVVFLFILLAACSSSANRQLSSSKVILDKSGYAYDPNDRSCDGYPRLAVDTLPGTCLGLVISSNDSKDTVSGKEFVMPRTIVAIPSTQDFLLIDMGGWKANNGSLFLLKRSSDGAFKTLVLRAGLNTPHGLAYSALDGFFYVGESQQIWRFKYEQGKMGPWQLVVGGLPRFKGHMHPLTQFTFDPRNNDLFINSGAPSDHCFNPVAGAYAACPEEDGKEDMPIGMGGIFRIPGSHLKDIPAGGIKFYDIPAKGLRNSMAMVVHPSGNLLQGENSRDFPELEEPYEEINVIPLSEGDVYYHYGWPYCFNARATSPEWRFEENKDSPLRKKFVSAPRCNGDEHYRPPHALMPPHSAPLHMAYYDGSMFSDLFAGALLVSWHGYQPTGHRLVAYSVDAKGLPKLRAAAGNETYAFYQKGGCPIRKPFKPQGGIGHVAPYTEVIYGWNEVKGKRPKGAPTGFTVAKDGSIFIVEDKNKVVVRLARSNDVTSSDCQSSPGPGVDPRVELLAYRHFLQENSTSRNGYESWQKGLVQKYCLGCHGNFIEKDIDEGSYTALDFIVKNGWIEPGQSRASKLFQAISHSGEVPPMPPGGAKQFQGTPEGQGLMQALGGWIDSLPKDIGKRFTRNTLKETRKLRDKPGTKNSVVCGQLDAGAGVYIDTKSQKKEDGWLWIKTVLVPGDSRLFQGACAYPVDGVFWMATTKAL